MSNAAAVLVAIPAVSWMYTEAVIAQRNLRLPSGSAIAYSEGAATLVRKRNEFVAQFLALPQFSHLFFLDSDMTPPPDTVMRLLSHELPIVGALMFGRIPPYSIAAGFVLPDGRMRSLSQAGGPIPVVRVDWHGTGALLIERSALLSVPQPWFEWGLKPGTGEDCYFTCKASEAGIPVHCDTGVCVGHLGITHPSTSASWLPGRRQSKAKQTLPTLSENRGNVAPLRLSQGSYEPASVPAGAVVPQRLQGYGSFQDPFAEGPRRPRHFSIHGAPQVVSVSGPQVGCRPLNLDFCGGLRCR